MQTRVYQGDVSQNDGVGDEKGGSLNQVEISIDSLDKGEFYVERWTWLLSFVLIVIVLAPIADTLVIVM